ncbi:hypothetical protein [Paenibacillus sp. y28]|uniref:hypothetical protein n=1 Tax=Paenibacillus sp. y28 TaxID=3129110 RepID=UPI00301843C9
MLKYGIIMAPPEGKQAGFYAQFVKALAAEIQLFDRDKELLIVNSMEEQEKTAGLCERYQFGAEPVLLLMLPVSAETKPLWDDYGFQSRAGHRYLYHDACALFRFHTFQPAAAAPEQAEAQMDEHLLAALPDGNGRIYAVDSSFKALMEGIARAYMCAIEWLEPQEVSSPGTGYPFK